MRIAILTMTGGFNNYGNIYQNYALAKYLENKGHKVDTISYKRWKRNLRHQLYRISPNKSHRIEGLRHHKFKSFVFNNQTYRYVKSLHKDDCMHLNDDYDYFIVGSDQIWNPYYMDNDRTDLETIFLEFAPSCKTISYSPSIGVKEIDKKYHQTFIDGINHISYLSVREEAGKDLIESLTKRKDCKVVIDPTMLLTKEEWEKASVKPDFYPDKDYALVIFLGGIDDNYKKIITDFCNEQNILMIDVFDKKSIYYTSSPGELLYLIKHSKVVLTNSFHMSVFSIIFNRDFITFKRTNENKDINSRIDTLLNTFDLKSQFYKDNTSLNKYLNVSFTKILKILNDKRKEAYNFLDNALGVINKNDCTGCSACYNICPKKAITMEVDHEGFKYPKIDNTKCINCGLCRKTCPVLNSKQNNALNKCYGAYNKDETSRLTSSSGGIFELIAKNILNDKGIVIGAAFDKNNVLNHIAIDNIKDLDKLKGSKYIQSDLHDIFKLIKDNLSKRRVLFVGLPCQVAGLKFYLGKDHENLFCIDLVCHGVPSPKFFKKYIDDMENKEQDKLININFRDKKDGWKNYATTLIFKNKSISTPYSKNIYSKFFLYDIALRESCFHCHFKLGNKYSDLTIGDYWGVDVNMPELYNDKGVSAIIINTKKGNELYKKITTNLVSKECNIDSIIKGNGALVKSCNKPRNRKTFLSDLDNYSMDELYKKYEYSDSFIKKVLRKIKRIIKK